MVLSILSPGENAARTISLADALDRQLVSCILSAKASPDSLRWKGGHGLELCLQNNSGEALSLNLETGRTFRSLDSSFQHLILTEGRVIALQAAEKRVFPLTAYCLNQSRKTPAGNRYQLGKMAGGILLKLAGFLHRQRIYAGGAQAAIWVVSGNASIDQVTGRTKQETRALRSYLYDLTGRPRPPRSVDPLAWPLVSLQGSIAWDMPAGMSVSLMIVSSDSSFMTFLFRDRDFPPGPRQYSFEFTDDALVMESPYHIRLIAGNAILVDKQLISRQ